MGAMQAREMAALGSPNQALTWHLKSNHYPPIPGDCVTVACEAIAAILGDRPNRRISMRDVGEHRVYGRKVPAWAIAEAWHLGPWIEDVDDDDSEVWG